MRTTIDSTGRVVVPKPIRDALGFAAGTEVEIEIVDGRIEIAAPATPMELVDEDGFLVATTDRPMPTLSAATVRAVLEAGRR